MIYGVYAYRDNKTSFGPIWHDYNDESAKRGFSMMMSKIDSIIGFAPADFDLFKIGTFDSDTGRLDSVWPIEFLISGTAAYMEGGKYIAKSEREGE